VVTPPAPHAAAEPLVLIVDDNERNRRLARDVLRAAGLRTIEGATGGEGLALAAEHVPDVILMDLELPDMTGAAAAQALGESTTTARIPVVALTAMRLEGGDAWLRASGFAGYVEKPFDVQGFPAQVRGFCAGR
jgi:two-component system, cell cycle response regulator DivK